MKHQLKIIAAVMAITPTFLISSAPLVFAATLPACKNTSQKALQTCLSKNPIIKDLNDIVTFLSAAVSIVVIGSLIFGGIQYSIAGDNAQQVSAAKKRITDSLIALVAFVSIFAFLQWIIPGGLFN